MASQNTQERHQAQLDAAKAKLAETAASLLARVQAFGQEMGVEYASTAAAQDAAKAAATQTGAAAKPQREAAKGFLLAVEPLVMQHALRAEMVQSLEAAKPSPAKQSAVDAPTVHAGTPPVRKINWHGLDVELDASVPASAESDILAYVRDKAVSPLLSGMTPSALADQATARRALLAMTDEEKARVGLRFADGHRGMPEGGAPNPPPGDTVGKGGANQPADNRDKGSAVPKTVPSAAEALAAMKAAQAAAAAKAAQEAAAKLASEKAALDRGGTVDGGLAPPGEGGPENAIDVTGGRPPKFRRVVLTASGPLNQPTPPAGFGWSNVLVAIASASFRPARNVELGMLLEHQRQRPEQNPFRVAVRSLLLHLYECWAAEDGTADTKEDLSPEAKWAASQADKQRSNLAEPIPALTKGQVAVASSRRLVLRLDAAVAAIDRAPLVATPTSGGLTAAEKLAYTKELTAKLKVTRPLHDMLVRDHDAGWDELSASLVASWREVTGVAGGSALPSTLFESVSTLGSSGGGGGAGGGGGDGGGDRRCALCGKSDHVVALCPRTVRAMQGHDIPAFTGYRAIVKAVKEWETARSKLGKGELPPPPVFQQAPAPGRAGKGKFPPPPPMPPVPDAVQCTPSWQLPAAHPSTGWPTSHSEWFRDWVALGRDYSNHLEWVAQGNQLNLITVGVSAGAAEFAACLAGCRLRRTFTCAEPEADVRPHRAAVRRLALRFPDQVDAACLRTADALGTSRAPVATALGGAPVVVVLVGDADVDKWEALLREVLHTAPRAAFVARTAALRTWVQQRFPSQQLLDASTAPWGAFRTSLPPQPPTVSTRPAGDALLQAERALGIAWPPLGLTAVHGVVDSPRAARARLAACARDMPVWALSVCFADVGASWCALQGGFRVVSPDDLLAATGVAWSAPAAPAGPAGEVGILRHLEQAVVAPETRPPVPPRCQPGVPDAPEVALDHGHARDSDEYGALRRIQTQFTAGDWRPVIDLFDDVDGRLSHPEVQLRLSSLLPLEVMLPLVLGKVCYGNLPYSKIKRMLRLLRRAVARDPQTRGTLILPFRPYASWWRTFVAGRRPLLRLVPGGRFRAGVDTVFDYLGPRGRRCSAGASKEDIVVVRFGAPAVLDAIERRAVPPPVPVPGGYGQTMIEDVQRRACGLSMEEAEAQNPVDPALQPPEEAYSTRPEEHADRLSDTEWREQCEGAAAVAGPWVVEMFGAAGAEVLDRWRRGVLDPVPAPEDWWPHGSPEHPTHLRAERLFLWLALAPELVGSDGAEAALNAKFGCPIEATSRTQERLPSFAPSIVAFLPRLYKELDFYIRAGIAVLPPEGVARLIHDALAVRRFPDDGKARLCVWFRTLNDSWVVEPFDMPSPEDCLRSAEPGDWILRRDLTKAFLQLTVRNADVQDMGFVHPVTGVVYCFRVPMFGLTAAPRCLHITMQMFCKACGVLARALSQSLAAAGDEALAAELVRAADALHAYADDLFWAASPRAAALIHLLITLEAREWNLSFDPSKDIMGRIIVVLGAQVSAPGQTMEVSPLRAHLYRASLQRFLAASVAAIERRSFEVLVGRLNSVATSSRWLHQFMIPLFAFLYPDDGSAPDSIPVTAQLRTCLTIWVGLLAPEAAPWRRKARWDALSDMEAESWQHELAYSDASTAFGYGVAGRDGMAQLELAPGLNINVRETHGVCAAAMHGMRARPDVSRWVIPTDNRSASARVRKGGSRDPADAAAIHALSVAAVQTGVQVRAPWAPGRFIIAMEGDAASRQYYASAARLPAVQDMLSVAEALLRAQLPGAASYAGLLRQTLDFRNVVEHWCHVPPGAHTGCRIAADRVGLTWSAQCVVCSESCNRSSGVACRSCLFVMHRQCSGVGAMLGEQHIWTCPACLERVLGAPGAGTSRPSPAILGCAAACVARSREGSTEETYGSSVRRFIRVMDAAGEDGAALLPDTHSGARATSVHSVVSFIGLAARPQTDGSFAFTADTIGNTVSALRRLHSSRGLTHDFDKDSPIVKEALQGARRIQRSAGLDRKRAAVAVTAPHMRALLIVLTARRNRMLAAGDLVGAYGVSRDALWFALAYCACLRKKEVTLLTRKDVCTCTSVRDALDIFIPTTKNNQDGARHLQNITIPTISIDGLDVGEIWRVHLAVMDLRGCTSPDVPLFGHLYAPATGLSAKGQQVMDRLHQQSPNHVPYYAEFQALDPSSAYNFGTKTHAFRRGGISAIRRHCVRMGFVGDGLLIFLRVFGRWKSTSSVLQYLVLDRDEMIQVLRTGSPSPGAVALQAPSDAELARLALTPEPSDTEQRTALLTLCAAAQEPVLALPGPEPVAPPSPLAAGGTQFSAGMPFPSPPPQPEEAGVTHAVAAVRYLRHRRGRRECLISWAGAPGEDSWEPDSVVVASDLAAVPFLPPEEVCCVHCELPDALHISRGRMLLCDSCGAGWHVRCWDPSRSRVPRGSWLCPDCES